jgi:hypothetical protein
MAQQTAVEWLELVYHSQQGYLSKIDIEQAKAMEKEQIIKAFESQKNCVEKYYEYAEQYYNETYNK